MGHPHAADDLDRFGAAALVTAGVGVAALTAKAASISIPCPLLATTGVACPACGMTRLADAVAHARLVEAVTTDPAGVVLLAVVGLLALGYVIRCTTSWRPRIPPLRAIPALLLALLGVHWTTTLVAGGFVYA